MAACSSEPATFDGSGDNCPEENIAATAIDGRFMFRLNLDGDNALSRAANDGSEFDDAGKDEWEVGDGRTYALLFTADGKFYRCVTLEPTFDKLPEEDNISALYEAKVKILEEDIEDNPMQCLIFANAKKLYEQHFSHYTEATTLTEVINESWSSTSPQYIGRDDNGLFTMCNSVYASGTGLRITVPVTYDNLIIDDGDHFYTQEEIDNKTVIVQIERMVAKYSFSLPRTSGKLEAGGSFNGVDTFTPEDDMILYCDYFETDGTPHVVSRSWRARVTGWGVNALEKKSYVVKNVNPNGDYFPGWNDAANWRCYWAEDFNYTGAGYPMQYRHAVDKPSQIYYQSNGDNNILKNYSYNDLNGAGMNRYVFVPENTYDASGVGDLEKRTHLLAGTHLIVCAELVTDIPNKGDFRVAELYRDYNGVFYRQAKDCFWSMINSFVQDVASHNTLKYNLYNWDEKETLPITTYEALTQGGDYRIYYNDRELTYSEVMAMDNNKVLFIPANIDGGDGRVIPWIDGITIRNSNGVLPIYKEIVDTVKPGKPNYGDLAAQNKNNLKRTATDNDIKSLLLEWLGPVDHFNAGKMYYAAPSKLVAISSIANMYGVVRNNWYSYNLIGINKIGTSVDDLDQPIVPDEVITKDRINVNMTILPWHSFTFTAPLL